MYKSYREDRGGSGYKGGGARKFGGSRGGQGGGDGMHDATCATCGNNCQVPFKPYPGKSIYCNNCFKRDEEGGGEKRPSFGGKRPYVSTPRGGGDNSKIEARLISIEEKLDALIEALTEGVDEEDEDDEDGEEEEGSEQKS